MGFKINIIVNGLNEEVPDDSTIATLIKLFNELDENLIVEHNGNYIFKDEYDKIPITENDTLEFINPVIGG